MQPQSRQASETQPTRRRRKLLAISCYALGAAGVYIAMMFYAWRGASLADSLVEASFWLWSLGVSLFMTGLLTHPPGRSRTLARLGFAALVVIFALIYRFAIDYSIYSRVVWWP